MSRVNQLTHPPTKVDITSLRGLPISNDIYHRGVRIYSESRVKQNSLYPWRFKVSGDSNDYGSSLYIVDIASHECSCMWFQNTGTTCKHLVAALLEYVESQPELLSKV